MSPAAFTPFLYPYMTPGTTEQLEESGTVMQEKRKSCSVCLPLELPRGALESRVLILVQSDAWKLQQVRGLMAPVQNG